ncbi:MAG: response regulator [Myxococcota bacterium]|nr:response regulator [Myxococcota bacterium]
MAGEELLIVDSNDRDREGLRRFFDQKGFVCTAARSSAEAHTYVTQKFFPAALIDLDVDTPSGGLELIRFVRDRSRQTGVVLMNGRRSYEGAIAALRLGVQDVIEKTPDQVEHMRQTVELAAARYKARDEGGEFHREIRAVLNESFKVILELARRVYADLSMAAPPMRPKVLFVDGDGEFLNGLAPLVKSESWEVLGDTSGGAALDRGSRERIDIIVARDELPDLRGSMVIKTLQAERSELLGLLYHSPGPEGRIDRIERGQVDGVIRPFEKPEHLLAAVRSLTGELATKAQERRLIQTFRAEHTDYLRRYAKVKSQIDNLIED